MRSSILGFTIRLIHQIPQLSGLALKFVEPQVQDVTNADHPTRGLSSFTGRHRSSSRRGASITIACVPHSSLGYKPPAPEIVAWPVSPAVESAPPAIAFRPRLN